MMKTTALVCAFTVTAIAGVLSAVDAVNGWCWREGIVDPTRGHLELQYGPRNDADWDRWIPIARIGPPVDRIFPVQFVVAPDDRRFAEAIADVCRELDYYLVELGKDDPWEYAIYHTRTLANLYSRVHWQWVNPNHTRE